MPSGGNGSHGSGSPLQTDSDSHFEQLMVSMLEERDRLLDTLRETQETLGLNQGKLQEVTHERDSLQRQLNTALPQVYISLNIIVCLFFFYCCYSHNKKPLVSCEVAHASAWTHVHIISEAFLGCSADGHLAYEKRDFTSCVTLNLFS